MLVAGQVRSCQPSASHGAATDARAMSPTYHRGLSKDIDARARSSPKVVMHGTYRRSDCGWNYGRVCRGACKPHSGGMRAVVENGRFWWALQTPAICVDGTHGTAMRNARAPAAPGSGSEGRADAVSRRLQTLVRHSALARTPAPCHGTALRIRFRFSGYLQRPAPG
jgi:hypothetical protein